MISSVRKFPLRTQFLRFQKQSKQATSPHLRMLYLQHSPSEAREGEVGRLSVIVPKKVSKLATTRNYLKRLVYDSLYPHIARHKMGAVIIFKSMALKRDLPTKQLLGVELNSLIKELS